MKAWDKAKAEPRESGLQVEPERAKAKTKSGTHPNVIFREQETVESAGTRSGAKIVGTRSERTITETEPGPKIMGTETLGVTKRKPTPGKWPDPEAVPLTGPVR
jgi:hypothetical protein